MSKVREDNSPKTQQIPDVENDARVETLLFLGIIFWCWMLYSYFQGGSIWRPENPLALYGDGDMLRTRTGQFSVSRQGEDPKITSAAVAPFLFQPLPVNYADAELLATLSGIGPELAAQIVKTRDSKGLFTGPQDLLAVPGIGPGRMKQFAPHLSFSVIP